MITGLIPGLVLCTWATWVELNASLVVGIATCAASMRVFIKIIGTRRPKTLEDGCRLLVHRSRSLMPLWWSPPEGTDPLNFSFNDTHRGADCPPYSPFSRQQNKGCPKVYYYFWIQFQELNLAPYGPMQVVSNLSIYLFRRNHRNVIFYNLLIYFFNLRFVLQEVRLHCTATFVCQSLPLYRYPPCLRPVSFSEQLIDWICQAELFYPTVTKDPLRNPFKCR